MCKVLNLALFVPLAIAVLATPVQAEHLYAGFIDPSGDGLGLVDVVGMLLSFDQDTGVFSLILLAEPSQPFAGDLRFDINLFNTDTGTTSCDPSLVQLRANAQFDLPGATIHFLSGVSSYLRSWQDGDRVSTNSAPFGSPDCIGEFHSAVGDPQSLSQHDLIAEGSTYSEIWTPFLHVDDFEVGDTAAWSETVGLTGPVSFISLQVTPTSVPRTGGLLNLLALVKDDVGQGVPNAPVNFLTQAGTLASGGGLLPTDSNGQAADTLTLTSADIDALGASTFVVRAQTVDFTGTPIHATFVVRIQTGAPIADFSFYITGRTVTFLNASTGDPPLSYFWSFGDGTTSTESNPVHTYATGGTYTVILTASNSAGTDSVAKSVTVSF